MELLAATVIPVPLFGVGLWELEIFFFFLMREQEKKKEKMPIAKVDF